MQNLLKGKTILVMGVANERSIAWGIAQSLHNAGAKLAFTYQGERVERRIKELVADMPDSVVLPCDVTKDEEIDAVFATLEKETGTLHGLVHSLAFANKEDLEGLFVDTSRAGYALAQDISAYSLVAVTQRARKLMKDGGSILTMTYLGGERVVQGYNMMGVAKAALDSCMKYLAADLGPENIRVNAISAGPIMTLAARGVRDFSTMLKLVSEKAPLRRGVTQEEVGNTALFLMSDLSSGITGEIIHVDAGYNILAL
ncbi:enoyl-ACP reductase FabI [Effusibacillus lacus]|uniref:Enoyl-[acyl-carrier-protein] reductase [NADH] n=1 Tax=Effusibacillus lacus TaxID=1348429 RepID=A0A292YS67_9BACL|nr:enoyl-ACP reductase FabI [Effusibacillus lacus]TCS76983.1 enoyl-[acyl-carrier-protein] reductase [NADH] [Effusibacillus lacus]GAX91310.1 enoyl-[acyl-carrier-protein] reductase [Effusibacillus lacus]